MMRYNYFLVDFDAIEIYNDAIELTKGDIGMEKLTMTVEEAGKVLGISRPTAYKLVQRADFPVVRVGHRLLVSTEGLREWVKKEAGAGAGR